MITSVAAVCATVIIQVSMIDGLKKYLSDHQKVEPAQTNLNCSGFEKEVKEYVSSCIKRMEDPDKETWCVGQAKITWCMTHL